MMRWRQWLRPVHAAETETTETDGADEHGVIGERGIASVNRTRSLQSRVGNVLALGLILAVGLGLLTWYYSKTFARQSQAQHTAQAANVAKAQAEMPLPALGPVTPPAVVPSAAETLLGSPPTPPDTQEEYKGQAADRAAATRNVDTATYGNAGDKTPTQLALERRLSGPAFTAVSNQGGVGAATAPTPTNASMPGNAGVNNGDDRVATLLRPTVTSAVSAQVLPTERLLLPKGAFIDCTLETAIDSSLPGLTTCITATDTFSADGKVVLLERGTKLVGETRGDVRQGSARVFVLWTEARTPTGVVVPLASPGTDELGRSGLPGTVNRHFWERFGAAILVSVIDGAIQSAVQSQHGGGTVIVNPSASQDIMTEILKSTINIPPTLTKRNGDRIQVLVARDLDFRSVYELRSTRTDP